MVFWHLFVPLLRPAELTRYTVALTPFFATGSQGVSSPTSYILEDYHRVEAYAISLTCHNSLSARSHHGQSARQRGALGSYPPPPRQLIRPAEVVRRRICLPVTTMPFCHVRPTRGMALRNQLGKAPMYSSRLADGRELARREQTDRVPNVTGYSHPPGRQESETAGRPDVA
jgi:hypothetical protein